MPPFFEGETFNLSRNSCRLLPFHHACVLKEMGFSSMERLYLTVVNLFTVMGNLSGFFIPLERFGYPYDCILAAWGQD